MGTQNRPSGSDTSFLSVKTKTRSRKTICSWMSTTEPFRDRNGYARWTLRVPFWTDVRGVPTSNTKQATWTHAI